MIIRAKHRESFSVINNRGINDPDLSFKATGLLSYLLSKPEGWKVREIHLETAKADGRDSVRSALRELEEHGYLIRRRKHRANGTFDYESVVYDEPQVEKPTLVQPTLEESTLENPLLVNTELVNTELLNTELVNTEGAPKAHRPPKSEAVKLFRERTKRWPNAAGEAHINSNVSDLEVWGNVLNEWLLRGFSPVNVKGMVEWYRGGVPTSPVAKHPSSQPYMSQAEKAGMEFIEMLRRQENGGE